MAAPTNIYQNIASRTGGDIYIGIVGPVRTGKSTFIKRFMETLVIPNITNENDRERTRDEMPQSAAGRTVMTTEPKFIPDEAVSISVGNEARMRVKMIDCVGYMVPDVLGNIENGAPRMVHTPWSDEAIPFDDAAEIGTRKVIREHSTIGLVVTTDGTIGDIPRENYISAEERVIRELKQMGKPFAIILNSAAPDSAAATELAMSLEEKYNAPVALVNCTDLNTEDIKQILELVLMEFPVREITLNLPSWTGALDSGHWLMRSVIASVSDIGAHVKKTGEIMPVFRSLTDNEYISDVRVSEIDLGTGGASLDLSMPSDLYYRIISEMTGLEITGEDDLVRTMRTLAEVKQEYDKFVAAIDEVNEKGYGIVMPDIEDLTLEEPEIVKQAGGYGVRLRASAPSIHMIRATIETEINPIVGTEAQSEELVRRMLDDLDEDPRQIWESNMFGKTLYELVNEGLHTKLDHMPDDARNKLSETLARIINEGSGGLICIIL